MSKLRSIIVTYPFSFAIGVRSRCERIIENLSQDFGFLSNASTETSRSHFRIVIRVRPGAPRKRNRIRGFWNSRVVGYRDGSAVWIDWKRKLAIIKAPHSTRGHELGYLLIQSLAGWNGDLRGWHRVHAAGILTARGEAELLLGKSGAGKTHYALEQSLTRAASIYSDESPMIAPDGALVTYPVRFSIANAEKLGVQTSGSFLRTQKSYFSNAACPRKSLVPFATVVPVPPRPASVTRLRIIESESQQRKIRPLSGASALAYLFRDLVVGIGLIQMIEFMPRAHPRFFWELTRVFFKRSFRALSIVRGLG